MSSTESVMSCLFNLSDTGYCPMRLLLPQRGFSRILTLFLCRFVSVWTAVLSPVGWRRARSCVHPAWLNPLLIARSVSQSVCVEQVCFADTHFKLCSLVTF